MALPKISNILARESNKLDMNNQCYEGRGAKGENPKRATLKSAMAPGLQQAERHAKSRVAT